MVEEVKIEISALKFAKYFIGFVVAQLSITLNPSWEILIISTLGAGILAGWNYLKHKYPILSDWITVFGDK